MRYTAKGIIIAIEDVKTTNTGIAVQKLHFEHEDGGVFYPSALGVKVDLLKELLPGDVSELTFHLSGSKGTYNNVIIDDISIV